MRICFVLTSLGAGGAERVAANLTAEWVRTGHQVTIVTFASARTDFYRLDPRVERRTLDLLSPSASAVDALRANWRRLWALRREFAALRPDAIVSFMDTTNVLVIAAAGGLGIPVVVSERIDPRRYQLGRAWTFLRGVTYRYSRTLVVQTESIAEWGRQLVEPRRVAVLPNPISDACFSAADPRTPRQLRVVAIGRLVPQKGFDTLIAAFDRAAATRPDWSLVIAGQGPLEAALRAQAQATRCADRIAFAGLVSNPEALLASSELFVLSSRFEGFPNALAEAMACGCAVIATDCPSGPAEMISRGHDGLLVPVDDVGALADALDGLMAGGFVRRRLGDAAHGSAARFRLDGIAAAWLRLLGPAATASRSPRFDDPRLASER